MRAGFFHSFGCLFGRQLQFLDLSFAWFRRANSAYFKSPLRDAGEQLNSRVSLSDIGGFSCKLARLLHSRGIPVTTLRT